MTDSLIQKLRDATGGSAELDLEIWALAGGWKLVTQPDSIEMRAEKYDGDVVSEWETVAFWDSGGHVRVYHAFEEDLPRYSRSLDAIIGLIEEKLPTAGFMIETVKRSDDTRMGWSVSLSANYRTPHLEEVHKEPAIALCLALLSALEVESDG